MSGLAFFDLAATAELRQCALPYSYLDFETISFSVPEVIGTRRMNSCHFSGRACGVFGARCAACGVFGRRVIRDFEALARALIAALPMMGAIFAYNAIFEERVLLRLAELVPAVAQPLRGLAERLVDLLPITRTAYYHRDMRGRGQSRM